MKETIVALTAASFEAMCSFVIVIPPIPPPVPIPGQRILVYELVRFLYDFVGTLSKILTRISNIL